jgi:hypothetical protein
MVPKQSDRTTDWDQWLTSQTLSNAQLGGWQQLGFTDLNDIVLSLCIPHTERPVTESKNPIPPQSPDIPKSKKTGDNTFDSTPKSTDDGYALWETRYDIIANQHTMVHLPVANMAPIVESVNQQLKSQTKMNFPPTEIERTESEGQARPLPTAINHKLRPTSYEIVFKGRAVRLNYPVPVPSMASMDGKELSKIGSDVIKPYTLGGGVDPVNGKRYSIHGLYWEKRYSLPSPPQSGRINTDGHSAAYV